MQKPYAPVTLAENRLCAFLSDALIVYGFECEVMCEALSSHVCITVQVQACITLIAYYDGYYRRFTGRCTHHL